MCEERGQDCVGTNATGIIGREACAGDQSDEKALGVRHGGNRCG